MEHRGANFTNALERLRESLRPGLPVASRAAEEGMSLFDAAGHVRVGGESGVRLFDVTGAGDTVIAVVAANARVRDEPCARLCRSPNHASGSSWSENSVTATVSLRGVVWMKGGRHRRGWLYRQQSPCTGLNASGVDDIIAVDDLTDGPKYRNLLNARLSDYFDKDEFLHALLPRVSSAKSRRFFTRGACFRYHGAQRPLHVGKQLPALEGPARCLPGAGYTAAVRVVGPATYGRKREPLQRGGRSSSNH